MANFRVTAEGPGLAAPVEKIVDMAVKADYQLHAMRRLYGRQSVVKVWGENGQEIGASRLATLVRDEQAKSPFVTNPASSSSPVAYQIE